MRCACGPWPPPATPPTTPAMPSSRPGRRPGRVQRRLRHGGRLRADRPDLARPDRGADPAPVPLRPPHRRLRRPHRGRPDAWRGLLLRRRRGRRRDVDDGRPGANPQPRLPRPGRGRLRAGPAGGAPRLSRLLRPHGRPQPPRGRRLGGAAPRYPVPRRAGRGSSTDGHGRWSTAAPGTTSPPVTSPGR